MSKNLDVKVRINTQAEGDGAEKAQKGLAGIKDKAESALFKVKALVAGMGLLGGLAIGSKIVSDFSNLDDAVRRAAATTGEFEKAFPAFLETAKKYGEETRFTALEAAGALQKLAMAGLGVEKSIATLPEVLRLSSASGTDLATSADILTNIMSQYGATVSELPQINDKLVKTFTSTNTGLQDLGYAFSYVGPVAKASNQSFSDLSATLGILGNNGFQGERSGTALRSALIRLQRPPKMVRDALAELGITITDNTGKMRPFLDIIDELGAKSAKNAQIFKIFGTEAAPAIVTLVSQGTKEIRKLSTELDNSGGTAKKLAEDMESGLGGAVRLLNSAVEGTVDSMGQVAESPIKEAIQIFTQNVITSREQLTSFAKTLADLFNGFVRGVDSIGGFQTALYVLLTISKALGVAFAVGLVSSIAKSIASFSASTAATMADVKAKQLALQAEIALTQSHIRATAAQILVTQATETRILLSGQLTALNEKLAISNQQLAATETELAAATGTASLTASLSVKTLLTPLNLLSVALAGLVGWDIGQWGLRNFAWVEKTGTYIAQLIAQIEALYSDGSWSERMAKLQEVNEAFADQRKAIGDNSLAEREAAQESAKLAQEKKAQLQKEREQALKDAEQTLESDFDAQVEAQDRLSNIYEDGLKRQIKQFEAAQKEKEAVLKQQFKGDALNKALLDSEIETNQKILSATIAHNDRLLSETTALYNKEIEQRQKFGIDTGEIDKARQNAELGILKESEKAYETSINHLVALEQKLRDKALDFRKQIEDQSKNQADKLRELDAIGLSDAEQLEQKKQNAIKDTQRVRELASNGNKADIEAAIELSKSVQNSYFDIAKAAKTSGNESDASIAREQYNNSVKLTNELLSQAAQKSEAEANTVKAAIDEKKAGLVEVQQQIDTINQKIISIETATINVDTKQVTDAIVLINSIPNKINVEISTVVVVQT